MYTINPTCPLCGLRYADRGLLDLHMREDHAQRQQVPQPRTGEPGDTGPPRPTPPPVAPARASAGGQAPRSALTRVAGALRRLHQETMLASALVVFRVPSPPRPQATTPAGDEPPAVGAAPAREQRPAADEAPARSGSSAEHAHSPA